MPLQRERLEACRPSLIVCLLLLSAVQAREDYEVEDGPSFHQFLGNVAANGVVLTTVADSVAARGEHEEYGVLQEWLAGVKQHNITNYFVTCYDEEARFHDIWQCDSDNCLLSADQGLMRV